MLESPAGCGVGPAERREISSAASGRRAARATVAGFLAVGRGTPRPLRAEGAARAGCLGLHRAARARGPQPCSVSGLFTAPTALLRREDGRRSGGPLRKQDRRGWELRPAPGRGHRPRVTKPEPCVAATPWGPTQASARSALPAGSRPRSEAGPSPAWPRGSEGNEGVPRGFLERSIPAGRTPLPATHKIL
uniref:Uncharacterized protein n=1 Tax=Rangifer tarandus platyrhynchus TaxID=3082113 RepID=A0ACB0F903_RANTA|nr:unnamed protein product [Rangifer tarandus platyrhynchus]